MLGSSWDRETINPHSVNSASKWGSGNGGPEAAANGRGRRLISKSDGLPHKWQGLKLRRCKKDSQGMHISKVGLLGGTVGLLGGTEYSSST